MYADLGGDDDSDCDYEQGDYRVDNDAVRIYSEYRNAHITTEFLDNDGNTIDRLDAEEKEWVQQERELACANTSEEKQDKRRVLKELFKQMQINNASHQRRDVDWMRRLRKATERKPIMSRFLTTDGQKRNADGNPSESKAAEELNTDKPHTEPEIFNVYCIGKTKSTPEEISQNVHCLQCLPTSTEHYAVPIGDPTYDEWARASEKKSMHRFSFNDFEHTRTVPMGDGHHPTRKYEHDKFTASVLHWGQLKLLMSEIDFLTEYMSQCLLNPLGQHKCKIIYAGASPGHHLPALIKIFPGNWEWELIDVDDQQAFVERRERLRRKLWREGKPRLTRDGMTGEEKTKIIKEFQSEVFFSDGDTNTDIRDLLVKPHDEFNADAGNAVDAQLAASAAHARKGHFIEKVSPVLFSGTIGTERATITANRVTILNDATLANKITNERLTSNRLQTFALLGHVSHKSTFSIQKWTDVTCKQLKKGLDTASAKGISRPRDSFTLLISDIRNRYNPDSQETVASDMEKQRKFFMQLQPYQAMMKFKLSYGDRQTTELEYPTGQLRYQVYPRFISHETRLITNKDHDWKTEYPTTVYDHAEYEKRMFHFNSVLRTSLYNTHTQKPTATDHPTLHANKIAVCNCYDCYTTRYIMQKFIREKAKVRYIQENFHNAAHSEFNKEWLMSQATDYTESVNKEDVERDALALLEILVTQMAYVQGRAGGYDWDLDG